EHRVIASERRSLLVEQVGPRGEIEQPAEQKRNPGRDAQKADARRKGRQIKIGGGHRVSCSTQGYLATACCPAASAFGQAAASRFIPPLTTRGVFTRQAFAQDEGSPLLFPPFPWCRDE